jgi:molybdopterin converting factor small subunit
VGVRIHLHRTHRRHAGGRESVEVDGATVGKCLEDLVRRHPAMGEALFDAGGGLRSNVEIYLNMRSTYPGELERPTADGDEIHVTVMLAGG